MSDRNWALEQISKIRVRVLNGSGCPDLDICDVLDLLCRNLLDDIERCGCANNYPKGQCPHCECPTCHRSTK
jgi:hypothetical protein